MTPKHLILTIILFALWLTVKGAITRKMQGQEDLNRKQQNQAWKTVIMTLYHKAIHMTLVWLSFWNEFLPSPCVFQHSFTWYWNGILLLYKSFWFLFWMKLTCGVWNLNWKQTLFWIENRKSYRTVLTLFSESELIKKGISSGKWGAIPVMQPEKKMYIHSFILHCNQTVHVGSKICKAAPKPLFWATNGLKKHTTRVFQISLQPDWVSEQWLFLTGQLRMTCTQTLVHSKTDV